MPPPSKTNYPLNLQIQSYHPAPVSATIQPYPTARPIPKPLIPNSKASFPPNAPYNYSDVSAPAISHLLSPPTPSTQQRPRDELSPYHITSRLTAPSTMSSRRCDERVAISRSMGAQNHEKMDRVYLRRQQGKLSREVLRTVSTITIPMYKLPKTPHSSVISIDSAGGHNTHQSRLQARPKDWGEVLGEVFKRKDAPIPGSSNLPPSSDSP